MFETQTILIFSLSALVLLLVALVFLIRGVFHNGRARWKEQVSSLEKDLLKIERFLREESARERKEAGMNARNTREEVVHTIRSLGDSLVSRMTEIATLQKNQLDTFSGLLQRLTALNDERMERMRATIEERLKGMQEENGRKLEEMRATVGEKLHDTLEKRLGESFKLVTDRLEKVHKGLGEMHALAIGVGDLKRALTNVKIRGGWGEVQLRSLLEDILTEDQFKSNVATKSGSNERVEFAIRLPGHEPGTNRAVWLPIDAKFPQEDYQRLIDAQEKGDAPLAGEAGRLLEARIKREAKAISEKYLDPPNTTDFGVMFLPTEGLYAEALRRPGLPDFIQREHRVVITGPTTIAALLNSLQMGFKTLAIERRSSEVWKLLGTVRTEFGRFGDILDKTHKKLQEATDNIESASKKSRTIERRLGEVQRLPSRVPAEVSDGE